MLMSGFPRFGCLLRIAALPLAALPAAAVKVEQAVTSKAPMAIAEPTFSPAALNATINAIDVENPWHAIHRGPGFFRASSKTSGRPI
jgi:hypothetical protein